MKERINPKTLVNIENIISLDDFNLSDLDKEFRRYLDITEINLDLIKIIEAKPYWSNSKGIRRSTPDMKDQGYDTYGLDFESSRIYKDNRKINKDNRKRNEDLSGNDMSSDDISEENEEDIAYHLEIYKDYDSGETFRRALDSPKMKDIHALQQELEFCSSYKSEVIKYNPLLPHLNSLKDKKSESIITTIRLYPEDNLVQIENDNPDAEKCIVRFPDDDVIKFQSKIAYGKDFQIDMYAEIVEWNYGATLIRFQKGGGIKTTYYGELDNSIGYIVKEPPKIVELLRQGLVHISNLSSGMIKITTPPTLYNIHSYGYDKRLNPDFLYTLIQMAEAPREIPKPIAIEVPQPIEIIKQESDQSDQSKTIHSSNRIIKKYEMDIKNKLIKINEILINMDNSTIAALERHSTIMNQKKIQQDIKHLKVSTELKMINGEVHTLFDKFIYELEGQSNSDVTEYIFDNSSDDIEIIGNTNINDIEDQ